jgi:tol-pal system protein YbgF
MNRKILLVLAVIFAFGYANADSQTYGLILQKQSEQIEYLTLRIAELEKAMQELNIQFKKNNIEGAAIKDVAVPSAKQDVVKATDGKELPIDVQKEKSDYDIALATLKDGDFSAAEKKFADFIATYPSSKLQSNATFWYSETFYRRDIFNQAAINYLKSYKQYPNGDKAPDALFKLADSLAHLSKDKEACSMLEKLNTEFPSRSTDSLQRAKEMSDKLHCK